MERWDTYRSTLHYALAIAGSELNLAVRLGVPVGELKNWLDGIVHVPDRVFLQTVDIIIGATKEDIVRTREALRKSPKLPP